MRGAHIFGSKNIHQSAIAYSYREAVRSPIGLYWTCKYRANRRSTVASLSNATIFLFRAHFEKRRPLAARARSPATPNYYTHARLQIRSAHLRCRSCARACVSSIHFLRASRIPRLRRRRKKERSSLPVDRYPGSLSRDKIRSFNFTSLLARSFRSSMYTWILARARGMCYTAGRSRRKSIARGREKTRNIGKGGEGE